MTSVCIVHYILHIWTRVVRVWSMMYMPKRRFEQRCVCLPPLEVPPCVWGHPISVRPPVCVQRNALGVWHPIEPWVCPSLAIADNTGGRRLVKTRHEGARLEKATRSSNNHWFELPVSASQVPSERWALVRFPKPLAVGEPDKVSASQVPSEWGPPRTFYCAVTSFFDFPDVHFWTQKNAKKSRKVGIKCKKIM